MKTPATRSQMPLSVRRILQKFGSDLNVARRKRRLSARDLAAAAGISIATLWRLEKGDPSVSFGAVAMALLALGEAPKILRLLDVSVDNTGLLLDLERLPKRIRRSRHERQAIGL